MKEFCTGFILGCILRNHVLKMSIGLISNGIKTFYSIKRTKVTIQNDSKIINIDLIVKVKNKLTNPDKRYFKEKGIFKMKLSNELLTYCNNNFEHLNLRIEDICDLAYKETGGYHSISKLGDVYLYFTYLDNSQKFVNVYCNDETISRESFDITYNSNFKNLICATLTVNSRNEFANSKIEYITKYFKMFLNNKSLTLETFLLNYDNINTNLLNTELLITYPSSIQKYSITDKII
jgi:hypothetical protein